MLAVEGLLDVVPSLFGACRSLVVVAIETGAVLVGSVVPPKRLTPALADIGANAVKYLAEYRRLNP